MSPKLLKAAWPSLEFHRGTPRGQSPGRGNTNVRCWAQGWVEAVTIIQKKKEQVATTLWPGREVIFNTDVLP